MFNRVRHGALRATQLDAGAFQYQIQALERIVTGFGSLLIPL